MWSGRGLRYPRSIRKVTSDSSTEILVEAFKRAKLGATTTGVDFIASDISAHISKNLPMAKKREYQVTGKRKGQTAALGAHAPFIEAQTNQTNRSTKRKIPMQIIDQTEKSKTYRYPGLR